MATARDQSGAALVVVAASLVTLLAFAALALDGGLLFNEKRHSQNAADHAALAAAWADCQGEDPQAAAEASVQKNGFEVANLTFTANAPSYTAQIDSSVNLTFARVIGFATADVTTDAVAECVDGGGGGGSEWVPVDTAVWAWYYFYNDGQEPVIDGVFANGDGCSTESSPCTGNPIYDETGGLHVRDDGQSGGGHYIDPVTCTDQDCANSSGNFTSGVTVSTPAPNPPFGWVWEDFTQTGQYGEAFWGSSNYTYIDMGGTGTWSSSCPSPGVYVIYGNAEVPTGQECGKSDYRDITVIAFGWIDLRGSDPYVEPFDRSKPDVGGLVLASFSEAAPYNPVDGVTAAIKWTGQDPHVSGLVYAPNGNIGEGGQDLRMGVGGKSGGALVGESVSIYGQDPHIIFDPSVIPAPPGQRVPVLME